MKRLSKKRPICIEAGNNMVYIPLYSKNQLFDKQWYIDECIEPYGFIYMITNIVNNKIYIGKTIYDFVIRFHRHLSDAKHKKSNMYLHGAIRKYGAGAFEIEVISNCYSKEDLDKKETHFILEYNSYKKGVGYNMITHDKEVDASVCPRGFSVNNPMEGSSLYELWVQREGKSEADSKLLEFKEKQADISRKKFQSGGWRYLTFKGRLHSDETKQKLSRQRAGKNNPMYGKSPYQIWVEKYGVEEADRRKAERQRKVNETRKRNGSK